MIPVVCNPTFWQVPWGKIPWFGVIVIADAHKVPVVKRVLCVKHTLPLAVPARLELRLVQIGHLVSQKDVKEGQNLGKQDLSDKSIKPYFSVLNLEIEFSQKYSNVWLYSFLRWPPTYKTNFISLRKWMIHVRCDGRYARVAWLTSIRLFVQSADNTGCLNLKILPSDNHLSYSL